MGPGEIGRPLVRPCVCFQTGEMFLPDGQGWAAQALDMTNSFCFLVGGFLPAFKLAVNVAKLYRGKPSIIVQNIIIL